MTDSTSVSTAQNNEIIFPKRQKAVFFAPSCFCYLIMDNYKTIKFEADDSFTEKRSKFIGYAKPVKTNDEAVEFINYIKQKHWDATHNVYAYVLRDGQTRRYSDDGEPQGTAGIPVLDVLLKEGLTDIVVVVTRYFGGILLGTGGLVRAYSHSAKLAVTAAKPVTMALCSFVRIRCDYTFYGKLNSMIPENGGTAVSCEFTDNVEVLFTIPSEKLGMFDKKLIDASNGKYTCEVIGEDFAEAQEEN